jgi:hypothetical protein
MTKKTWQIYWWGLVVILVIDELLQVYNFITQPSLDDYFVGKAFVYGIFIHFICLLIFIAINIYTLIVCIKAKQLVNWCVNFVLGILFLIFSIFLLSEIDKRLMPIKAFEQTTNKKLEKH